MLNLLAQNPLMNLLFCVLAYILFQGGLRPQIELTFFTVQILGILTSLRAIPVGGFSALQGLTSGFTGGGY